MERKMDSTEQTEREFLDSYSAGDYERPSVTVDMLIFALGEKSSENYRKLPEKEIRLLLIKRRAHPFKGFWAIPGGFVQPDEGLDRAAARELREETGLGNVYMEQLYTWGEPNRDPRTRVISTSYMALVSEDQMGKVVAGDDAAEAKWFTVTRHLEREVCETNAAGHRVCLQQIKLTFVADDGETLRASVDSRRDSGRLATGTDVKVSFYEPTSEEGGGYDSDLAFDHAAIVNYALDRIESKAEWTNLVFNLMPRQFTLTELQRVYEVLLSRHLEKANFRRKIKPMVLETEDFTSEAGHRPARLYEYNQNWNGGF
jgi:ADP-ribose pyrophosphatase YjhB (NUDIX family)